MPTHHVIVGSGIGGLSAAETLRTLDPAASITLVSEETHDFYSRPGLAYFLRTDIPEKQLFIRSTGDLKALNISRVAARVENVLCEPHELVLTDGKRLRYDRLLLATGALATPPTFPGGDLAGIVKLDGLDDTRHIVSLARKGKSAVVVGGGITALELAEGLNARGMRVNYFLRGERYWADVLDETESLIVMQRLRHEGITIRTGTQIKQVHGVARRVTEVETQAGDRIPCEVIAVAIGVRPRVDLANKAGLKVAKGIVVDECLRTSDPDVFAAGDCAEVFDPQTGKTSLDVLWPTALAQGKAVAANMTGAVCPYVKGVSFNVTMLAGLKVAIIGAVGGGKNDDLVTITRGESEAWRARPRAWSMTTHDDVNRVRMLVGERTIVGALVMGDQTWTRPLQRLIVGKVDITPIRAQVEAAGAGALPMLAEYHQQWERANARPADRLASRRRQPPVAGA